MNAACCNTELLSLVRSDHVALALGQLSVRGAHPAEVGSAAGAAAAGAACVGAGCADTAAGCCGSSKSFF
jgi:hypothetical protein